MNVQSEVQRLLLTDLSQVVSEPTGAEEWLRTFVEDLSRVAAELGNELSRAFLRDGSIAHAISINRAECDEWDVRRGTAADAGHDQLVQRALKRKNAYESILTALRDQQTAVQNELQMLRHQMAALQAITAHAKAHLEVVVARRQQSGIS